MKPLLGFLLCVVPLAGASRGYLVDAGCFQAEEKNVNPDDINLPGAHDVGFEIRACYPRANKTKKFMVVLSSGEFFALDAAGDAEASRVVSAAGRPKKGQDRLAVNISGTVAGKTIHVDSLSPAR
ncbi:MAG TPA: hypothetical protein VHC90_00250 [Bryobacteraceae bacterium]|nr:hypothetical protein [Bryobacteraceae bacterium]